MRVVVDTNVLASGIFWAGAPHRVLEAWAAGAFTLCVSPAVIEEYFEVIDRLAAECGRGDLAGGWKTFIFEHSELIEPDFHYSQCRDPDDARFIECAVSAGAGFLVSGDDDLLSLPPIPGLQIVKPADFLKQL